MTALNIKLLGAPRRLIVIIFPMKLTDDQKVQIFCAALNAYIQAEAVTNTSGVDRGSGIGVRGAVEKASQTAGEAIAKLQSKAWA